QQVAKLGFDQDALQEVEGRCVEPLQIVEEERQRMFGSREYPNHSPQSRLEAGLGGRRSDVWNCRLRSDDEPQLRDEVTNQRTVGVQGLSKLVAPTAQFVLGLAEELANQSLDGLRDGGVGNVSLELIEFARCEKASWRDQHPVQFIHQR